MGTQNADDQEVFEIVDFTTASEWECFIAAVVEAVHEWRLSGERQLSPLSKGQLATAKWSERTVEVKFAEFPFKMTHHCIISETVESPPDESEPSTEYETEEETEKWPQALDDIMNRENDFPARAHCLVRWYGLREFVTLSPSNANQPIICPSKSKLLLSSLTIAANNTNCQVPMFVYVLPPSEKMYLGVGLGSGVRTDYDMIHMRHPPRQCTHLSGLLDVFRSKLKCNETSPPVLVSVRFTYILSEWPHTLWTQQPPDFDATLTDVGFSDLGKLPFGALSDPVSELHLSATWPCVSEDVLVDSDVYSDLDPGSAPLWTARLVTNASPPCLLSEYLTEFLHVCRNNQSVTQILGPDFTPEVEDAAEFSSALDRLTEPSVPTLSKIVGRVRPGSKNVKHSSSQPGEMGPISVDILVPILNYLFPDAEGEEQSAPFPSTLSQVPEWTGEDAPAGEHPLKALLSNMKSSGVDGLVWRLAIVLCHVIHSLGGLPAAAHIWHEVVLELRFRWDNAILVPGIGSGSPDLASTLLHQKLQMLNCCIIRRRAREQSLSKSSKLHNGDSSEEEENWKNSCDTGTSLPISEEVSVGSNESFADALGYHSSDAKDDELSETCSNSSTANTVGSIDASDLDAVLHHSSGCKDLRFTAGTLFESFIIGILNKCFKIIGKYSSSKWESNELYVEEVITSFSDDTEISVGTSEERIANVQINKCQGTEDHILEEINVSLNGNPKSCLNSCGKSLPDYSTEQGNKSQFLGGVFEEETIKSR